MDQQQYVGPLPPHLKIYRDISTSETVTYLLCGDSVIAWTPNVDIYEPLKSPSLDISKSSLISAQLEKGTLITTGCTPLGLVRCSNTKTSIQLPLQKYETCLSLIQQNNMAIVATSAGRLFLINNANSSFRELITSASGNNYWMLSYVQSWIWDDPTRNTVSLTWFDSGILHLTSTHAHIYDVVEEDDSSNNKYQIRHSVPVLTTIAKNSHKNPTEIVLLHAKFFKEVLYVLSLIGEVFMLYSIVENRATTQIKSVVCRTISKDEIKAYVELLLEPIQICENEIYILFKDRVFLSYVGDLSVKPIQLLESHIYGSMVLPGSVLFYTAAGIFSRNRKEAAEKKEFHDIFNGYMADSSTLNVEFLKPLVSFTPTRIFDLVQEHCSSVLVKSCESMLVQSQLKEKSDDLAIFFKFLREVNQYISIPHIAMCLLFKYSEDLNFASLVRSELKNTNHNSFLSYVFWQMQNKTSTIPDLYSPQSATPEVFFSDLSHVSKIFPTMIEYQQHMMKSRASTLPILYDTIVSACYFFDVLLQKESKLRESNNFGFVPFYALSSTRSLLKEQFELIQQFFVMLKQSAHTVQVKTSEVYDKLYGSVLLIVNLVLSGYLFECEMKPGDQELYAEFREVAKSYIDCFARLGRTKSAETIAKNYKIFDSLIPLSSEKKLEKYKREFGHLSEFNQCLYAHYLKLGKITELLEDPLFCNYYDNDYLRSLYFMSIEDFEACYTIYVSLSNEEKNLAEKKRLVAIRKLIAFHLERLTKEEDQLLQIINIQDPAYLESLPDLKPFQDFLFQHHPKGTYIEPIVMIETLLSENNRAKLFFEDFVTLFHIFSSSSKLRKTQDNGDRVMSDIWRRCLTSTNWDELKFDSFTSDTSESRAEIRKTLLYRVATHPKHTRYFVTATVEFLKGQCKGDNTIVYRKLEAIKYIQKYNEEAEKIKKDKQRLDQLFYDELFKPEAKPEPLIFESLLKPVDITSMLPRQRQSVAPTNSLFHSPRPKANQTQKSLNGVSSQPPAPSMKKILSERNTLTFTLGSLKAKQEESFSKNRDEERNNASVNEMPVVQVKQEQPEIKLFPQSPLKLTVNASELSDLKKNRLFSFNSPNNNKNEFSLSDALDELGIDVDESTLGPFDGHVPEGEVEFFNINEHLKIPFESEYSDVMEEFENYFEKKQRQKTPTKSPMPYRSERSENPPSKSPLMSPMKSPMKSPMPNFNEKRSMERSPMNSPMANRLKK